MGIVKSDYAGTMRVAMTTEEYPLEIYGGAGIHATELARFMRGPDGVDVNVHCMGTPHDEVDVYVHGVDPELRDVNASIRTLSIGLRMANVVVATDIDVVHSHTQYSGLGGHLIGLFRGIPYMATAHSPELHRLRKCEQLGGGYDVFSWSECNTMEYADAVIAVSVRMKDVILDTYPRISPDKVHAVLNGIDAELWYPCPAWKESKEQNGRFVLEEPGVDPSRPMVAFAGRITRQKGVAHLVKAVSFFDDDVQLVLHAGVPDAPEAVEETEQLVHDLQKKCGGTFWVQNMLSKEKIQETLAAADSFICPSIYKPLGTVSLEAMVCGTAAAVSDVGGTPEVVVDSETGTLVHYDESNLEGFEREIATAVNDMVVNRGRTARAGQVGKKCVEDVFSWENIAEQTVKVYKPLM